MKVAAFKEASNMQGGNDNNLSNVKYWPKQIKINIKTPLTLTP